MPSPNRSCILATFQFINLNLYETAIAESAHLFKMSRRSFDRQTIVVVMQFGSRSPYLHLFRSCEDSTSPHQSIATFGCYHEYMPSRRKSLEKHIFRRKSSIPSKTCNTEVCGAYTLILNKYRAGDDLVLFAIGELGQRAADSLVRALSSGVPPEGWEVPENAKRPIQQPKIPIRCLVFADTIGRSIHAVQTEILKRYPMIEYAISLSSQGSAGAQAARAVVIKRDRHLIQSKQIWTFKDSSPDFYCDWIMV
ncbi:hypothetical protein FS749_015753 [Ceratobasidium sp. UAMH 11750]|nr:hypothetical protein FS749_015753 [Ceratobasidium sp. UAMH 11750]